MRASSLNVCGGPSGMSGSFAAARRPAAGAAAGATATQRPVAVVVGARRRPAGALLLPSLPLTAAAGPGGAVAAAAVIPSSFGRSAGPCSSSGSPFSTPSSRSSSLAHRRGDNVRAKAAAAAGAPDDGGVESTAGAAGFLGAFWKFLRPHTIRGTILGTTAVVTRALLDAPPGCIDWALLPRALLGLLALLCGNGYIVGINQIYDVDIDALNKPFLPVAAGELTPRAAWLLVAGLAATGLTVTARNFGPLITQLYAFGLFLGTVYSTPPLRLKRFAVPAFAIIATVRGFLLNFGVYHATRAALGLEFAWSPPITFITCFVTAFATAIAVTKDLPDVEGDRANGITTFATRLGVPFVANVGIALLACNYAGAIAAALLCPGSFNVPLMVGAHAVLAAILAVRAAKLAAAGYTRQAVAAFYRWVWNLFYSEYALLPFL